MVITILVAASFMSSAMGYLHVPQEIAKGIAYLDLGPVGLIILLGVFYVILGLFLDGLSIMVMTLPITLPLIGAAGFDAVWFGVFLVIMIELGLVTPPIGFNLFVLQGLTGQKMALIAKSGVSLLRAHGGRRNHRHHLPGDRALAPPGAVRRRLTGGRIAGPERSH